MNFEKEGTALDLFAFPPETNARFNLLSFGATAATIGLSITMWATMTLGSNLSRWDLATGMPTEVQNWRIILFVIGAPVIGSLSVLVLFGLSYYKFRKHPARIISEKNLQPLKPERDEKFLGSLKSLATSAGLKTMPVVFLGPPRAQDGQAFGFRDRPILRLGPSLKMMRLKKELEPLYRAITLHEMAHIINDDISRTYFSEAIWSALRTVTIPLATLIVLGYIPSLWNFDYFVWMVFIPVIILLIALFVAFELVFLLAVLQFIRRGALRVREIYADQRAARWGAYPGLVQILSSVGEKKRNWWKRFWEFHPRKSERLQYLQNPEKLFHVTLDLPFSLGFLSGVVLASVNLILSRVNQLYRNSDSGFVRLFDFPTIVVAFMASLGITFLLSWLAATSIGLQVQRQATADRVYDTIGLLPPMRLFLAALVFHLALEIGIYFMPYDTLQIDPSTFLISIVLKVVVDPTFPVLTSSLFPFLIFPFWILFTAGTLWLWMGLIRLFTKRFVSPSVSTTPPLERIRFITIGATLLLPFLYIPSALSRYWLLDLEQRSLLPAIFSLLVVSVLVLIGCLVGWAWLKNRASSKGIPDYLHSDQG